ncbi:AcrR family transcriptional regulator [Agromyces cerinus]|uniref:TetR/AcrR family transcriptional regulator n=1 Tax=Agromyces cerinus TaxID=33878 RepID=UPI00195B37F1|nr:TetR/AcrR family transcriptional regulator [Agromyces cerinus]MBM7831894.1 AcrR family transcriptional regulator [Agromyces cerinus]
MPEHRSARERILDAAERLFADRGFDATPTSTVAALADVPKGLLFYYFPAKADLLRALVTERLDLGPIDPNALVAPGDPVSALLNLAGRLSELQADSEVLRVIIWREQRTHPEVRARLREHRLHVQAIVERVLRGSVLRPIASRALHTAAAAWVAILSIKPHAEHESGDDAGFDLRALAELICAGLDASEPA